MFRRAGNPLHERIDVAVVHLGAGVRSRNVVEGGSEQLATSGHVGFVNARNATNAVGGCAVSGLSDFKAHANQAFGTGTRNGAGVVGHLAVKAGEGHGLGFVFRSPLSPVGTPAQQRMVETFRVLSQNGHVHHTGLPDLPEATVDFVRHAFVEFDGANVRVEVQAASQTENHRAAGEVAVWKTGAGIADSTEEDGIGFVLAELKGAFSPLFTGCRVVLAAAFDDGLFKTVVGVRLDRVKDSLSFQGHLATRSVAGQNRDAMVTHGLSHRNLLHERNPRS